MGNQYSSDDAVAKVGGMGRLREDKQLYRLVDLHGSGELIPWIRYAERTGDHSIIDSYIDIKVGDFLFNQGKGKLVTVTELVKLRNKERNALLGAFLRKKGKGKSGPNVLDDLNQEGPNTGDLKKALKLLDGGGKGGKTESKYREICWRTEERAIGGFGLHPSILCFLYSVLLPPVYSSMGETLLGVCLMLGTDIHNKLAIKLLDAFPKLVNDISVSEDYYGLSPLHQAIVNQDPRMVAILLRRGADVHQRCYGAFFCADDQKASRTDSLEHEYVELSLKTNYTGYMYFGEYPLSFAACMNHQDCYRLLIAHKANPNAQDTNGNTVLHLCVIHENLDMFRLAIEKGASLRISNKQGLTPLTLAARLAKIRMFHEILSLEGESVWVYGEASQTAYPLAKIDSINEINGDMNEESVLSLVVYGETKEHLDLMDGLLEELLESKWAAYGRRSWLKSFIAFCFYYVFFFAAFMTRPFSLTTEAITKGLIDDTGMRVDIITIQNQTSSVVPYDDRKTRCHLREYSTLPFMDGYFRLFCEVSVMLMVLLQVILDFRDVKRIGRQKWFNIYKAFPAKLSYKLSFVVVILLIPVRASCHLSNAFLILDNVLSNTAVILTTVHFLFYCRAIKFVGPFVLMVYTIIATDIVRFLLIYSIFLIGFSQAFYLMFLTCQREYVRLEEFSSYTVEEHLYGCGEKRKDEFQNIMKTPTDALIRTFIMTIGEFMVLYRQLSVCPLPLINVIGKVVFLGFELFVSILQFNLLIAMMTRTYETIFLTRKEWKRQWAQVILMLELSLSPKDRLHYLLSYSRPTGTNKKQRSYVVSRKIQEEHERHARSENRKAMELERRQFLKKRRMEEDGLT